jgi:hypothetical protein
MTQPNSFTESYISLLVTDISQFLWCELIKREISIQVTKHVVHAAAIRCITNKPLVVAEEISLRLLLRHWATRMITVMYHSLIVATTLRPKIARNVLAIRGDLENELNSDSSQQLSPIVVGSMGVALLNPYVTRAVSLVTLSRKMAAQEQTSRAIFSL